MPHGKKTNKQVCHKDLMINQLKTELAECRLALENEKAQSEVNVEKNHLLKLYRDELSDADKKILKQEKKIVELHEQMQSFTVESDMNKKRSNKEMFPCEVCLRPYSPELKMSPRVLDCGHTLCFTCVERLINKEGTIKCPFDQTPTELQGVDIERGLPRNFAVLNMCT
ncbi:unnamed protein product [Caenorhabditis brenneri]